MKLAFVDLHRQYLRIKESVDEAIETVIRNSAYIGGEQVTTFEREFSSYHKGYHPVACANGTDSLEIILQAQGVKNGDEVLVPALTWISTAEAVVSVDAKPVFVDVDSSGLMDVDLLESLITSRTKAIIPVHLYGKTVDMTKIMSIAKAHNLFVLEDCAQAHLAKWDNQVVGTFGHASSFSFFPGKNLGAYGDAGMMLLRDPKLAETCRMIAHHGQKGKHNHILSGRNSRLDGLQAAILNVKLRHLSQWTEERRVAAKYYDSLLKEIPGIRIPEVSKKTECVYHLYAIEAEQREDLKKFLGEKGISTAVHYPSPLPNTLPFKTEQQFPKAVEVTSKTLSLPLFPEIRKDEIEYVCEAIKSFYG